MNLQDDNVIKIIITMHLVCYIKCVKSQGVLDLVKTDLTINQEYIYIYIIHSLVSLQYENIFRYSILFSLLGHFGLVNVSLFFSD